MRERTFLILSFLPSRQVNEVVIAKTKRGKVEPGSEDSWTRGITIPFGITPSELPGCKIIGVEYEIAVSIRQVLVMCPILSSIEPSQLVVNPIGLWAAIPVRISARGEGDPIPNVVMPAAAAAKMKGTLEDQPMALRA